MMSHVRSIEHEVVRIGSLVTVEFERLSEEIALPVFVLGA
jgi:hypothetical protein